jgi:hypothetical protein
MPIAAIAAVGAVASIGVGAAAASGAFNSDAPEARNLSAEALQAIKVQEEIAPEMYANREKYDPLYAKLNSRSLNAYLTGNDTDKSMLSLYSEDIAPVMNQVSAQADAAQREADISAVERYGPRATAAIKSADPAMASLGDALDSQIGDLLARGGTLSPDETRALEQRIRSNQAARGLGYGKSDAYTELLGLDRASEARQLGRVGTAAGYLAQRRAQSVDPFLAILGRASSTPAAAASAIGSGQSGVASSNPQSFDPFNGYVSDLNNTNYNGTAANNIANSNRAAGITSGAMNMFGSFGGAAMKYWGNN